MNKDVRIFFFFFDVFMFFKKMFLKLDIRVGPEVVTDPAFLVTRTYEDFITWADSSKIKRHVLKYNDKLDDYDLL